MGSLRRMTAGQSVADVITHARTWNAFVDAAERVHPGAIRNVFAKGAAPPQTVLAHNTTATDFERGEHAVIDTIGWNPAGGDEELDEFISRPLINLKVATSADWHKLVIFPQAFPADHIGPVVIGGVCAAQVNVVRTWHKAADITAADPTRLTSCPQGVARFLKQPAATGLQWMLVNIGPPTEVTLDCTALGGITAGASGTARSVLAPVQDFTASFTHITGSENISSNKAIRIRWDLQSLIWRVVDAECE